MSRAVFDHEAALRYALHAAADQVQPREDGLERIQARLRGPRLLPVAWLEVAWTRLSLRLPEGFHLRPAADRVRQELRVAWDRFGPQAERGVKLGWLRPVAAMSVAVFIVAAVVYTAIEVPQVVSPSSNNRVASPQHSGGHGGQPGQGYGNGHSQSPGSGRASGSPGTSSGTNKSACPTTSTSTSPTIIASGPPNSVRRHRSTSSPSPVTSSPSPSTSPSSSSTSSPSPSTTPSSTGSPSSTPVNPGSGSGSTTPSVSAGSSAASGGQAEGEGVASPSSSPSSVKPTSSSSKTNPSGSAVGSQREANATTSPCPSPSPSKHKAHSTGSPAAAGLVLIPAVTTGQPGTEPDGQLYF